MALELYTRLKLNARHSLAENETPHAHTWWVEAGFTGPLHDGRVVSLPELRSVLFPVVDQFSGVFLNEAPELDANSREFPTCENLAIYFGTQFRETIGKSFPSADLHLVSVSVSVDEEGEQNFGFARWTP